MKDVKKGGGTAEDEAELIKNVARGVRRFKLKANFQAGNEQFVAGQNLILDAHRKN